MKSTYFQAEYRGIGSGAIPYGKTECVFKKVMIGDKECLKCKHNKKTHHGGSFFDNYIKCTLYAERYLDIMARKKKKNNNDCELCKQYDKPSEETLKAIEDAENGIGLVSFDSVDDMFKELEKDDDKEEPC